MNKVYWGDSPSNFGDVLTANLLDYFNIKYEHTNVPEDGTMYVIGSIARLATSGSTVLGSGMIRQNEKAEPTANWRFVRGPYTRLNILAQGGTCPEIYGDPALLLPMLCEESNKKYDIGIVPHYQHYRYYKFNPYYSNYRIINLVDNNPLKIAKEITKCKRIISTSLHGIICAHAFGIPAAHVKGVSKLHGDGSKFEDYYASIQTEHKISTVENPIYTDAKLPNLQNIIEIFKEYAE